jgi:hypothetical protein
MSSNACSSNITMTGRARQTLSHVRPGVRRTMPVVNTSTVMPTPLRASGPARVDSSSG